MKPLILAIRIKRLTGYHEECAYTFLLSCKSCKSCKSEQDIQDIQDVQDEEACGSRSVSLVMKPLILAILSVLAILLRIAPDRNLPIRIKQNLGHNQLHNQQPRHPIEIRERTLCQMFCNWDD